MPPFCATHVRAALLAALVVLAAACGSGSPTSPTPTPTPTPAPGSVAIMGPSRLTAAQIVAWFNGRQPRPAGSYAATVPVEMLAAF